MTSSSVLVTGSSGFIGIPVVGGLVEGGWRVIGLDPLPAPQEITGFEPVIGDLGDVHRLYRLLKTGAVDTVIHCGAISGPMLARDDPFLICNANIIGTIHLLEASRMMGVKRFVFCSSAAAYGETPPAPVPDDAPLRPIDLYGATKAACDLILGAYRRQYALDAVSLRIANAYGPDRRTRCAIRTMIINALKGRPTHFDWGADQCRPYLFIDDVVAAVLAAATAPPAPQPAYNIAGPEFVPMTRIGEIVERLVPGAEITFEPGLDQLGYERDALDISAAASDLGFIPQVTIEDGVEKYLEWMRNRRERW